MINLVKHVKIIVMTAPHVIVVPSSHCITLTSADVLTHVRKVFIKIMAIANYNVR